jgi:hypothetical protein
MDDCMVYVFALVTSTISLTLSIANIIWTVSRSRR